MQPRIPRAQQRTIAADTRETLKVRCNALPHVFVQRLLLLGEIGCLYEWNAHTATPGVILGSLGSSERQRYKGPHDVFFRGTGMQEPVSMSAFDQGGYSNWPE
jgi:hypothetical protein